MKTKVVALFEILIGLSMIIGPTAGITYYLTVIHEENKPYELEEYGFYHPFYTFWAAVVDNITIDESWYTYHTNGSFFFYAIGERIVYIEFSSSEINYFVMYKGLLYQALVFNDLNTDFLHLENITFWRIVK